MLFPQNKFSVRFFSSCRKRSGRKRSLGQDNIFSSVCQEFCPQGGLPQCMLEYQLPLASRHPPWQGKPPARQTPPSKADTPLSKADPLARRPPPLAQCMLGDTVNKRAVCILLECNLVLKLFLKQLNRTSFYTEGHSISKDP